MGFLCWVKGADGIVDVDAVFIIVEEGVREDDSIAGFVVWEDAGGGRDGVFVVDDGG